MPEIPNPDLAHVDLDTCPHGVIRCTCTQCDHGDAISALLADGAPMATCPGYLTGTGTVYLPEILAANVRPLLAAVDWSRIFAGTGQLDLSAVELTAAARYARALAEQCETFAETARNSNLPAAAGKGPAILTTRVNFSLDSVGARVYSDLVRPSH